MGPAIGVQVLADFSGAPGNRMRLFKEDEGRAQPTPLRRGRGGEDKRKAAVRGRSAGEVPLLSSPGY